MSKILLAALAALAVSSATVPASYAGTSVGIAIGEPYPGYYPYPEYPPNNGYPRRPHPQPDYDDDDGYDQISCWEGKRILRDRGFRNVQPRKCDGSIYRFVAQKAGRPWIVRVDSYNGRIVSARPVRSYY